MKLYICPILFFIFLTNAFSKNFEPSKLNIYGETNYSSSSTSSLRTSAHVEYSFNIYEPKHKKWGVFVSGKVNPLYDHLGKELKIDVFTVLGIDF